MDLFNSVLVLLAGIGVLLIGMKMMGDNLEKSSGKTMRKLFNKITSNRYLGIGIGTLITAIVQSSGVITVMTIGFVNAGIMSLFQAAAIILGANIGTTATGLLASLEAFDIGLYFQALTIVGVIMMGAFKKDNIRQIGGIVAGIGILFAGLSLISGAFKTPYMNDKIVDMFTKFSNPALMILLGIVITALVQSSSLISTILVALGISGAIDPVTAFYVVLGSNIGSCITAIIASMGASQNAKRTAFMHLMVNIIGVIMFMCVMIPLSSQVANLMSKISKDVGMQIAFFHLFFNTINAIILAPFIKQLVWLSQKVIKDKKSGAELNKLQFIDERILSTPSIAVSQIIKEVEAMAIMAKDNLARSFMAITTLDLNEKDLILKEEGKIDYTTKSIASYIIRLSTMPLNRSDEKIIGSLHNVISDIERIGDHAENFIESAEEMLNSESAFTKPAVAELNLMYNKIMELFDLSIDAFKTRNTSNLKQVSDLESSVDDMKKLYGYNHIERLNKGECNIESGAHFYATINSLERIADHLNNVAYSIKSPTGSQIEALRRVADKHAQ